MEETFGKEVRPLLDLIDRLRDMGVSREVSLPQIVVMGDQSSGKSSVLQSISGIPFPRGSGLVTRCPLELVMKQSTVEAGWSAEVSIRWSRDQPDAAGTAYNMDELARKVEQLSRILSEEGENGFSSNSIVVKLSSPDAPDLTLIDLPGIVRTATNGQSASVIGQVNALIEQYIKLPNTLILAVVPCNQDIATIDILERAAAADTDGRRTLGVLTKPDLICPGGEDEVVDVLLNIRKPLRLGYIMVKNSNQKQLNEKISLRESREDETRFFQSHPVFSKYLQKASFGVGQLTQSLTRLLTSHIKATLPSIIRELKELHASAKAELEALSPSGSSELSLKDASQQEIEAALQTQMVKKINLFLSLFRNSCRGEYREKNFLTGAKLGKDGNVLATNPATRLHAHFLEHFKAMQDSIMAQRPQYKDVSEEHYSILAREMEASKGRELPGFLSSQVFVTCMVNLVEDWKSAAEECNSRIYFSTNDVSKLLVDHVLAPYPALRGAIGGIAAGIAERVHEKMRDRVTFALAKEQEPFTSQDVLLEVVNSIRFRAFDTVLRQVLDTTDPKALGENKYTIEEDIKRRLGNWYMQRHGVDSSGNLLEMITMLQGYWDIASRRFVDNMCMMMEKDFLDEVLSELESEATLFGMSLTPVEIQEYMKEDAVVIARRHSLRERMTLLESSLQVLQQQHP